MSNLAVKLLLLSVVIVYAAASSKKECPPEGFTTIPHPKSCSKYYVCFGGKPTERKCPQGLAYDQRRNSCTLEKDAKCNLDVCPQDNVGIVQMVPHPEDCDKYFACARGQGLQLQCGTNLLFNQLTNTCDHHENVYCGPPTPAPTVSHCPPTGTKIIPFPGDCKKYYLCMEGTEAIFQCTGELVYDTNMQRCNHPVLTTCPIHPAN